MLFVTLYYGMLFTNWMDPQMADYDEGFGDSYWATVWIKISVLFMSVAFYALSVCLPLCCPGRVF